jgi:hypothetical protein
LPHEPQLPALPVKSTQLLPQRERPVPHPVEHLPAEHTIPVEHAVPHAPQFFGSDAVATQTPLHITWPAAHPQTPAVQACPVGHA